jgi:hypothetical protein
MRSSASTRVDFGASCPISREAAARCFAPRRYDLASILGPCVRGQANWRKITRLDDVPLEGGPLQHGRSSGALPSMNSPTDDSA